MGNAGDISASRDGADGSPPWVGHWRVRRYDGAEPSVPTYYDASPDSWDVIKADGEGLHVARHPILDVQRNEGPKHTLVLKDEGVPDDQTERWSVEIDGDRVRVVAETGPHAGAVGIADRIPTDPREEISPS